MTDVQFRLRFTSKIFYFRILTSRKFKDNNYTDNKKYYL